MDNNDNDTPPPKKRTFPKTEIKLMMMRETAKCTNCFTAKQHTIKPSGSEGEMDKKN